MESFTTTRPCSYTRECASRGDECRLHAGAHRQRDHRHHGPDHTEETEYAKTEDTELGRVYHELWLDLSRRPHLTGRDLQPAARARFTPVERWEDAPVHAHTPTDASDNGDDNEDGAPPPPRFPPAIIGPATTAFPRNEGWYLAKQDPRTNKDKVRKLSDLTIHNITDYLTSFTTQEMTFCNRIMGFSSLTRMGWLFVMTRALKGLVLLFDA